MNEFYRILGESGLGIALREDFARELRQKVLSFDDFAYLKTNSANIASGGHIDFIGASLLLYSVGFDDISSCSLIMVPSQRDFFCGNDYVAREMPITLNTRDNEVLYLGHNVDGKHQRKKLVELWDGWVERAVVSNLKA